MKKSSNSKILEDITVNGNEKLILSVYIKKQSILEADSLKSLTGCASRNEVIEKALNFFFAYTTSQISQDYLCGVLGTKMEGLINNLGTRISRGNFRTAVEMDMHTRMLASVVNLSKSDYDKMRMKSIKEVKQTNGSIDILEAVNETEDEV